MREFIARLIRRRPAHDLSDPKVRLMAVREAERNERATKLSERLNRENRIDIPPELTIRTDPIDKEKEP